MTVDRSLAHLSDMLAFVRELRALVGGMHLPDYLSRRVLNLAVEKLFINFGVAAQRVPEAERAAIAGVPWRQIIGLRNILAHGYEQVEHATLHRTVNEELGAVEQSLAEALAQRGGDDTPR
jgi:uncharacterized protein with HEPN domain